MRHSDSSLSMRLLLTSALALLAAAAAHAEPVARTAEAVLAANQTAVGEAPGTGATLDWGFTGFGLTGTRSDIADLATGAFVEDLRSDRITQATGYDGTTPWQRDFSWANTEQKGGDRVATAVSEAYRLANAWWRPDRGGAEIRYLGRESEDGHTLDHLSVAPRGGAPFQAWFDADTHLLARISQDVQFFHTRTFYDDYRREAGVMLAHKVTLDSGVGDAGYVRLSLQRAAFGPARPLTAYARPAAPPTGVAIDGGAASATVPFRLLNNHIYVQARVNGKGPYTFIVDTGGHNLLSQKVIREAGLTATGAVPGSGAGEGTVISGFVEAKEIAIGPVRMADQIAIAQEVYDRSIEGIPVDGMVGFELIARLVTRIDYGAQTITFTDPARFDPAVEGKASGAAVPFVFYDHLPMVTGKVGDLPARFDIDTGSRVEIDLTSPFVARAGLRRKFAKGVSAVTGWGVGGPSRSYVVRLPSLTVGPYEVRDMTAGLSEDKGGSISDPNYEGNIGSGFLKRFVVTFDYARQTMYLKPIVPPPADAGRFDRAGMWINAGPDGYVVTDVAAGGPAAQAGIAVGDVIVEMDGKPVKPEGLSDARIGLRARPAGTQVPVRVRRAAATTGVVIVLRDQI